MLAAIDTSGYILPGVKVPGRRGRKPKEYQPILDAIKAIKEDPDSLKLWGVTKAPANLKMAFRDGDTDREDDPAYANCYFLNANSAQKPGLVDAEVKPILDPFEVYSGCYGRASINVFAYNHKAGGKGIGFGLNNIQKLRDGEPLGGARSKAEDDFGGCSPDKKSILD